MKLKPRFSFLRKPDLWITILGFLSFALFFIYYDQAFPSASLKLELSKEEITALAENELRNLGFDPVPCKTSSKRFYSRKSLIPILSSALVK